MVFLLLTMNMFKPFSTVSIVDFEQVNVNCVHFFNMRKISSENREVIRVILLMGGAFTFEVITQQTSTCLKSTIETLEKGV